MRPTFREFTIFSSVLLLTGAVSGEDKRAESNSWLLELGYERVQRLDRNVDRSTSSFRYPAFDNQAFIYGRSNAMSVVPFEDPAGCGHRGSAGGDQRPSEPRECEKRWTVEFEGGADIGLDGDDVSNLWVGANLYFPIVATVEDSGIYNPYDTHTIAFGLSSIARHVEIDADGHEEVEIAPFFRLDCTTQNENRLFCNGGKQSLTSMSIEFGWSPKIWSSDDDEEHSHRYAAYENIFARDLQKNGQYKYELALRASYDDYYDFDDSARNTTVKSVEIGYNRVLFGDSTNCTSVNFDLTLGHEDINSERFNGSNTYLIPSIYLKCAPKPSVGNAGGGDRFSRRGQTFRSRAR